MRVLLISTYELGRQPFGLASPAAWLRRAGAAVTCADLSREKLPEDATRQADLVAFYVPMHTATRLAVRACAVVRSLNPRAHLCFYGLYAPVNADYLRAVGGETIIGGEFEQPLVDLYEQLHNRDGRTGEGAGRQAGNPWPSPSISRNALLLRIGQAGGLGSTVSLARQQFIPPERAGLPALDRYARLHLDGATRTVGYTEATRGCKHLCRHCPIVPVYHGAFRVVQRDVVMEDIRRQVGAGAQHITFGDPDFFNGPGHAIQIVRALDAEFPALSYDVTIKIEHLLRHKELLPDLRETGCLFVTSAVESVDNAILERLDKGHTRADFYAAVELCRRHGVLLEPTFIPFTPWTTRAGYCDLLAAIAELDLVDQVAPIQLAIRLLIPAGSRLLELEEVRKLVEGSFEREALSYTWPHADPALDRLAAQVQRQVWLGEKAGQSRREIFARVWQMAQETAGECRPLPERCAPAFRRTDVPFLNEPWYC